MRIRLSQSGDLEVVFAYEAHLVELVKTLPERSFDPERKLWMVPRSGARQAVEVLRPYGFAVDAEVEGLAEAVVEETRDAISVLELNQLAARAIASAFLGSLWVVGEVAEWQRAVRAHVAGNPLRFSLVDRAKGKEAARVQAVMFDDARQRIEAKIANAGAPFALGDECVVRVRVRPKFYAKGGTFQVIVDDIDVEYTLGEALRRRDEIIRRLVTEGLDRVNSALPLPIAPLRVGLVTRFGSDAYHDVHQTLHQSGYAFHLLVADARVQGVDAERTLLAALERLRVMREPPDVVLICRGGGARLDLAAFDSEPLARAVAAFPFPVIVGVGHEQDRSVLDHLARSARTPLAAAEMVVDAVRAFEATLRDTSREIGKSALGTVGGASRAVDAFRADVPAQARTLMLHAQASGKLSASDLQHRVGQSLGRARGGLQTNAARVAGVARSLAREEHGVLVRSRAELRRTSVQGTVPAFAWLDTAAGAISLADPRRVLALGYAILRREGGTVVRSASEMNEGETVLAELADGKRALTAGPAIPAPSDEGA